MTWLLILALGRPNYLSIVLLGPGVYAFMNENTKYSLVISANIRQGNVPSHGYDVSVIER